MRERERKTHRPVGNIIIKISFSTGPEGREREEKMTSGHHH